MFFWYMICTIGGAYIGGHWFDHTGVGALVGFLVAMVSHLGGDAVGGFDGGDFGD